MYSAAEQQRTLFFSTFPVSALKDGCYRFWIESIFQGSNSFSRSLLHAGGIAQRQSALLAWERAGVQFPIPPELFLLKFRNSISLKPIWIQKFHVSNLNVTNYYLNLCLLKFLLIIQACAAFFRRTVKTGQIYTCAGDNSCEINHALRQNCRQCRLAKCQEAGMKEDCELFFCRVLLKLHWMFSVVQGQKVGISENGTTKRSSPMEEQPSTLSCKH